MKLSRQNYKRNFVFIGFLSLYCYTERLRPQHTWCIPAQERPIGETRIRSWKWIFPLDNGRPRWASSSGQNSWSRTALRHSHLPSWRATIRQRTLSVSGIHGSNGRSSPCVCQNPGKQETDKHGMERPRRKELVAPIVKRDLTTEGWPLLCTAKHCIKEGHKAAQWACNGWVPMVSRLQVTDAVGSEGWFFQPTNLKWKHDWCDGAICADWGHNSH